MTMSIDSYGRIALSREGTVFRLSFRYDPALLGRVKQLPYAAFDPETKTWTCMVCAQTLDSLRRWRWEGLVDCDPDGLLEPGEQPGAVKAAVLRAGSARRPFLVNTAMRDDDLYQRLVSISGARWEKNAGAVSYPPQAATALSELVDKGILDDPGRLLQPAAVTVGFDPRVGGFKVRGDERAQEAFHRNFPERDVMAVWRERGLDVGFADEFSQEIYAGELARRGEGVQPAGLLLDLYEYQKVDVGVALERSGIGVWHGMGVGKTAIAIATAHEVLNNRQEVPRVVVVVPPALRSQWRDEIIRFTGADPDDVVVIDGAKKKRLEGYEKAKTARWLVVHYQAVILADDNKALSKLVAGSMLILDEAHRAKNTQAKVSKVCKEFANKSTRRMLLSGTPVENNPGEWYNLLSGLVYPGVFGSPIDFLNRYSYPGKFGGYEGARNIPELRVRSKPLYVRRTLNDVAQWLPKMRVQTVPLDPRPEYAAALRRAHREAAAEITQMRMTQADARAARSGNILDGQERDELAGNAEMTATGLLKLLCCSPRIVAQSDSDSAEALRDGGLVPDEDGPKIDELRTMCAELQAHNDRVVVFTSSKRMANLVAERLSEDGIRHVLFTGDTNTADRDAAVKAFTTPGSDDEPGPTVFISTDAGAEGLNLGRCCSTLINLDIPWTPGRLAQRNARVRRVDSTADSFLIVNLVLRGTIEEGVLRMVEHKADLADAILGESGGRRATTGRAGKNIFEQAMDAWLDEHGDTKR